MKIYCHIPLSLASFAGLPKMMNLHLDGLGIDGFGDQSYKKQDLPINVEKHIIICFSFQGNDTYMLINFGVFYIFTSNSCPLPTQYWFLY